MPVRSPFILQELDVFHIPLRLILVSGLMALATGFAYYWQVLHRPILVDEVIYQHAIEAVVRGDDLGSVHGWYYPTVAAKIWTSLASELGMLPTLQIIRVLNLVGCASIAACFATLVSRRWAVMLSMGVVIFYSPMTIAIESGNVTGILTGLLVIAGLTRSRLGRSLLLAPGFLLKPYALAVVVNCRIPTALLPAIVATFAFVDTRGKDSFHNLEALSNCAPVRALHDLGLSLPWQVVTSAILILSLFWVRGSYARALCAAWLSLPIVWDHTALLVLPSSGVALRYCLELPSGDRRLLSILGVLIAMAILYNARYFSFQPDYPLLNGLLGLLPSFAVILIASNCPSARSSHQETL